jgi:Leucine-rich repeat (LRR) protein
MYYTTFDNNNKINLNSINDIYNIKNPENVKELNLSSCNLTHLDKDLFKNLTQLQKLELGQNKLTYLDKDTFKYNAQLQKLWLIYNKLKHLDKDTFKYNTQLQELNLSNNKLSELDKNIFIYNTQLQKLILFENQLTYLDKDLFKYNTQLLKLDLYTNNLTHLDKDIFTNLTLLQYLCLSGNKLSHLDKDIFKYNTQLQELNLLNNSLIHLDKDIFKYNTLLQILNLYTNNLTQLPSSITRCRNLEYIHYHDNPINYIPPHIQRFLNRLKQQSNHLQVYNDGQNVHNHNIQECIKTSMENILEYPKQYNEDELLQDLINSNMSSRSKQLLLEYCQDKSIHTVLNINFQEALFHILKYINLALPNHKEEILKILETEILDSECKCFTGRISRLINCLNGFSPLVKVEIPENMGISNIIIMIKNKYEGDNLDELKSIVEKELLERGYEQEKINEYLEYIEI